MAASAVVGGYGKVRGEGLVRHYGVKVMLNDGQVRGGEVNTMIFVHEE